MTANLCTISQITNSSLIPSNTYLLHLQIGETTGNVNKIIETDYINYYFYGARPVEGDILRCQLLINL